MFRVYQECPASNMLWHVFFVLILPHTPHPSSLVKKYSKSHCGVLYKNNVDRKYTLTLSVKETSGPELPPSICWKSDDYWISGYRL